MTEFQSAAFTMGFVVIVALLCGLRAFERWLDHLENMEGSE
jgi:hypothetical protein